MNITNPQLLLEAWPIITIVYFVIFWGIPMLGMLGNHWAKGNSKRYWQGVRFSSFAFHFGGVSAALLLWYLNPYIFPVS